MLSRGTGAEEAQLADLHARPELDRQRRHVGQWSDACLPLCFRGNQRKGKLVKRFRDAISAVELRVLAAPCGRLPRWQGWSRWHGLASGMLAGALAGAGGRRDVALLPGGP